MKIFPNIQTLTAPTDRLELAPDVCSIYRLRQNSVLHAFALIPDPLEAEESTHRRPDLVLVFSALPLKSWKSLYRLQIRHDRGPGRLAEVFNVLNQNGLEVRRYSASEPLVDMKLSSDRQLSIGAPFPETTIIVENRDDGSTTQLFEDVGKQLRERRASLASHQPLKSLQSLVANLSFDSLEEWKRSKTLAELCYVDSSTQEGRRLGVDLQPWKKDLWELATSAPDRHAWEERKRIVVISTLDIAEHILVTRFYRQDQRKCFVIEFELLVPGGTSESYWWEFAAAVLAAVDGNIVRSWNDTREFGSWSVCGFTVVFGEESSDQDGRTATEIVRRAALGFRALQGVEAWESVKTILGASESRKRSAAGSQRKAKDWKQRLLSAIEAIQERLSEQPEAEARSESTLRRLRVWDSEYGTRREIDPHVQHIARNPYTYTDSLSAEEQEENSRGKGQESPRLELATELIRLSVTGSNVAVVGANRTGKTSMLNYVSKKLPEFLETSARSSGQVPQEPLILRLEKPHLPGLLFVADIYGRILEKGRQAESWPKELAREPNGANDPGFLGSDFSWIWSALSQPRQTLLYRFEQRVDTPEAERALLEVLRELFRRLTSVLMATRIRIYLLVDEIEGAGFSKDDPAAELLKSLLQDNGRFRDGYRSDRPSRGGLLGKLRTSGPRDEGKEPTEQATSKDRVIRWFVTSTLQARESNVPELRAMFREHLIGSLNLGDAKRLIGQFSSFTPEDVEMGRIVPVLTHGAQVFVFEMCDGLPYLMQIVLSRLHDAARLDTVAIMGRSAANRIISTSVLVEVDGYFRAQLRALGPEGERHARATVMRATESLLTRSGRADGRRYVGRDFLEAMSASHGRRVAAAHVGLRGSLEDGAEVGRTSHRHLLAPLVALWVSKQATEADMWKGSLEPRGEKE